MTIPQHSPEPTHLPSGTLRHTLNRLLPVGLALVGIGLSVALGHLDAQRERSEQLGNLAAHLAGMRGALEAQLGAAFGEAEGIAQLISADGGISPAHFHGMARDALQSVPYMRHIALAPGDVISDVYPLPGNERLIGLDYRQLPEQFPLLRSARDHGHPVLAGPLQLYQGGRALIYRRPVFVTGKRGVRFYWGNVSIVADIDRLLLTAGVRPDTEFELAVRGGDGKGTEGALIWGDPRLFDEPQVKMTVEVPGGLWQLVAAPRGGWSGLDLFGSPLFLFALSCTGVFSLFVAQLNRKQRLLEQRNRELQRYQAQLERLAHYDTITGLPNRILFQQQLSTAILQGHGLAVLMLDIDGFKQVNDSLGHPMGDLLLQQATARFLQELDSQDRLCRLGGDEFVFMLQGAQGQVNQQVRALLRCLQRPFDLNGNAALVTGSIGLAWCPQHGEDADSLLRHADTAMYAAKEAGRDAWRPYHPDMTERLQQRLELERNLRRALEHNEFELWYQPKVDLFSGQLEGVEALLRWRDPEHGLISPGEFIPLAERTGLIIPLGERVLELACAQLAEWRASDGLPGPLAINVAALQIERSDYVTSLASALERHGLPANLLEVEITESLLMESQQQACAVLAQLQAMGVATAVDDFGTGYSSLAYLRALPIDHLKIDRAFIKDLPADDDAVAIARAIIDLGHALGFRITAEGIETQEQYDFLRHAGCDQGQGFLLGRPMPAEALRGWLADNQERRHRPPGR
ncbi:MULTISPECIES: bifunctional diguanylate cyclase/phosphodiesterase [unclassified Pseudomonas]|uniref:putative bifunctional diguanylate cyclase/phosphodiesterase n=1 Tax=unclassified Pseudomonas TaxID=196821 RepID=UPI000C87F0A7|nr:MULTISPECIES: EAL domain-containing protein [unclassified Pseudomonas]PNA01090.1 bifunctional diguanylate cyclase/phosphodiesterase [Pseudomonas sp. FW305-42]PNA21107.1 bifunctional diguanylate cyclase/phosphodiesterase [Pseudomonas sp. MPR-R1B]PNB28056.1 bifunctional diguanylate cyclase/phosphodiesterase [Pseudomonas sp. DP16D-E2]PNB44983.1 bifunctional diguanylate cyclase/phosphodiesterase [Pseudomonas sp. FW305-17]PNB64063.1 bifunctional diguanylate cyclase/phosphodiesterase [Pseudomonas